MEKGLCQKVLGVCTAEQGSGWKLQGRGKGTVEVGCVVGATGPAQTPAGSADSGPGWSGHRRFLLIIPGLTGLPPPLPLLGRALCLHLHVYQANGF